MNNLLQDIMEFSEYLKTCGLSARDIATLAGVSKRTVESWKTGRRTPKPAKQEKVKRLISLNAA